MMSDPYFSDPLDLDEYGEPVEVEQKKSPEQVVESVADNPVLGALPGFGTAQDIYDFNKDIADEDYLGASISLVSAGASALPFAGVALGSTIRALKGPAKELVEDAVSKLSDEVGESKYYQKALDPRDEVRVPKKTVKAYKLFRVDDTDKTSDTKFFPLFVDAKTEIPQNKWISAKEGEIIKKGKDKGQVKSKIGPLAYRPGFHAGDYASATHIGGKALKGQGSKPNYRPANQRWAEVEFPADFDWQSVANSRASIVKSGPRKGLLNVKEADIRDQVPTGGFYRYKTNPNMQGNWLIGGEMRLGKELSAKQVKNIGKKTGIPDLPTLPELIAEKNLTLDQLSRTAVQELKKYYPDLFVKLGGELRPSRRRKMYEGGLMFTVGSTTIPEIIVGYDEVSGNPIPPGSEAEEVRDDVDVLLSEGEYVLPADVVRYWGVRFLEQMRQEAKMGLMYMQMDGRLQMVDEDFTDKEPSGERQADFVEDK
jgi:hypothetical protein